MSEMMNFPDTWEEYEKLYGFNDSEEIYTNNSRLIPSFRVKQWLDHIAQKETKQRAIKASDCIRRQDAKDAVDMVLDILDDVPQWLVDDLLNALNKVPSAEPEIAENLYLCKCYITDKDGLQHEVIHTGDIRRVTGWEI